MHKLFTLFFVLCLVTPLTPFAKEETMSQNPVVEIETNKGNIKIELYQNESPETVNNFLSYVTDQHYNGTIFHRVIDGFMIQGGGFTKEMKEKSTKAPIKNEAHNELSNERGTLAMARTSDINSATAQFFINVSDNDFLNYRNEFEYGYCVFGKVTEGMDVVDQIKAVSTTTVGPYENVPAAPVEIISVKKIK